MQESVSVTTKIYNGNYRKLSDEEIKEAGNVSLLDFLPSIGESIKREGTNFKWTGAGNSSVFILPDKPYLFKHFATGETGNAITFCQSKLGMTFQEAVIALNRGRFVDAFPKKEGAKALYDALKQAKISGTTKAFTLPKADKDNNKLIKYLAKERSICPDVLDFFIKEGTIYQTEEQTAKGAVFSNIAFVCKNFEGEAAGAIKRGFPMKNNSGFKGNAEGSDVSNYGFLKDGQGSLFVFEAPVDMLSYMSLIVHPDPDGQAAGLKSDPQNLDKALTFGYLATGGTHISSLINYLRQEKNQCRYQKIYLCHDNDAAGNNARLAAIKALTEYSQSQIQKDCIAAQAGIKEIICHFPIGKDWNDDLTNSIRSKDLIKGSEDEKVEAINKRQEDFFQQKNQKAKIELTQATVYG